MKPKNYSPFMWFVKEFREKNPKGHDMDMKQAVEHCSKIWENMDAADRQPYISKAKISKKRDLHNCHGALVSDIEAMELEAAKADMSMKQNIEEMVIGKNRHDLENAKFIFGSFNYFLNIPNSKICIPAEFSACEFSLKQGVQSKFNTKINPGELIFGQAYNAEHHSTHTHKLPLPPMALGESNMIKLYESICDYLAKCLNGKPLVVFTTSQDIPEVKGCFDYIENRYKNDNNEAKQMKLPPIHVYNIEYLFYVLKKEVMLISQLQVYIINILITNHYFNNYDFFYTNGIACDFHDKIDRIKYCPLSKVISWAYTFCDYMCKDLKITMEDGKHSPPKDT